MDKEKPTTSDSIIDETNNHSMCSSLNTSVTNTTARVESIHPKRRTIQNYSLIWLAFDIDQSKEDCQNMLTELQGVVDDINIFTQVNECVDFLTDIDDMKIYLIVEGTIAHQLVPLIHDALQLDTIYISCSDESAHKQWVKEWTKIKGVYTATKPICEVLQLALKQCNQDSIAISFVPMEDGVCNINLNQLEPSFMYTQIFKEILLEMEHDEKSIKDYIICWRRYYVSNASTLKTIDEFERDYCPQSSIRWYTRESFVYETLNRALRTLESDIIINMRFLIRDLHNQIQQLNQTQIGRYHGKSFTVYRGQGLSQSDFEKLIKSKGGLMSFNNFLSTSDSPDVSLAFAESASGKSNTVGVLFLMYIDPTISSTSFASIQEVSFFQTEGETLFSMHTVFRIGEITKIDNNSSLYRVQLTLTADDDHQLRTLIKHIREEVHGEPGWERLGLLLIKMGHFDKAEELYNVLLLEQISDDTKKATYHNNLGYIKHDQGDYKRAIENHGKALEIWGKTLPLNHPLFATSYSNIGEVYRNMGEYAKARSSHEKALEICQKILPANHPLLAASYNNIGKVYEEIGEYSKAVLFHEKALENLKKTLPLNHPLLASSYSNIGEVYQNMGEYAKARSSHKKALEIREKTLPENHPDFASSYSNIGMVYHNMGEYSNALSSHGKALEICQKTLSTNHPSLATSYNNIAGMYWNMGEYLKALSFYKQALEIFEKTLPTNYPLLATSYSNIAVLYDDMGEYSKALSFYKQALEIRQKTLSKNHPSLATSYNNIAVVYQHMREYSKALSFYKQVLEIFEKILPTNHPSLATSYNNIAALYADMGEYSKALSSHKKALEIFEKTLPTNYPLLATSYNNIAGMYRNMGEYSKALSFYKQALEIFEKTLPTNHPLLATSYNNIGIVYADMGEYSKALSFNQRALHIFQSLLPPDHPNIKTVQENIKYIENKL